MKEGIELVVLLLGDWIVFVVVALGASNRQSQPHRGRRIHAIDDVGCVVLLRDCPALEVNHVIAVEAAGDALFHGRARQQVAGQLLNRELIEWHIAVERLDDPFAPA
jgi:hypothetical protein